jgi:hypothetical protein
VLQSPLDHFALQPFGISTRFAGRVFISDEVAGVPQLTANAVASKIAPLGFIAPWLFLVQSLGQNKLFLQF